MRRQARLSRTTRLAVALLVATSTVGSCQNENEAESTVSPAEGLHFIADLYHGRAAAVAIERGWYRTLDDMTPNVTYVRATGEQVKASFVVAVGEITRIEPGHGFRIDGEDAPDGIATGFDDSRARWWTAHLHVRVDHGIGSEFPETIRVVVPSSGPRDFGKLREGFKALGEVVLFLSKDARLTPYDTSLYRLQEESGLMLATVAEDGTLAMPLYEPHEAQRLLANTKTLADLETRAKVPKVIPIVGAGQDERRADGL